MLNLTLWKEHVVLLQAMCCADLSHSEQWQSTWCLAVQRPQLQADSHLDMLCLVGR